MVKPIMMFLAIFILISQNVFAKSEIQGTFSIHFSTYPSFTDAETMDIFNDNCSGILRIALGIEQIPNIRAEIGFNGFKCKGFVQEKEVYFDYVYELFFIDTSASVLIAKNLAIGTSYLFGSYNSETSYKSETDMFTDFSDYDTGSIRGNSLFIEHTSRDFLGSSLRLSLNQLQISDSLNSYSKGINMTHLAISVGLRF